MVRSLAAKESAIMELGERLCPRYCLRQSTGGVGEERRLSPGEQLGGQMGR